MTQGGARASVDDEREAARHHRKQAASPARLKTDKPPSPACRSLAARVNGASSPVCVPAKRGEKSVLPQSLRAPCWDGFFCVCSANSQAGGGMTLPAAIPTLLRPVWRCRCLPWSRAVQGLCRGGRAMRCWVLGAGCWAGCWMLAIGAGYRCCGVSKPQFSGWPCRCRRRWRGFLVRLAVLSPACPGSSLLGRACACACACACWASDTIEGSKVRRGCGCGGTSLDNLVSQKPVSGTAFVLLLRRWHDSARAEPSAQSTIAG
jgi:hypothetical protein